MKISKLFHWLYAILMFLPILVFIPNAFYYGFNEQAVAQEKTEQVPVYYQSNEVESVNDLVIGNIYSLQFFDNGGYSTEKGFFIDKVYYRGTYRTFNTINNFTPPYISFYLDYIFINDTNSSSNIKYQLMSGYVDFVFRGLPQNNYINDVTYITKCDYQYIKEYQPLVTDMSITDSMSYAWKSTWQNDLFSWSYDSFLTQPFLFITNLFNVPATNTLLYCLSYWLNISIIWLCFDVVMYIPLLVHRWLDKGIVE